MEISYKRAGSCGGLGLALAGRQRRRSRRGAGCGLPLSAIFLLLAGRPLLSQQQPTFSTDVKVVNILATVREKKGPIVRNLTKDDFTLEESGRPQIIRYFSRETDLPLTLGLLVDTSLSQRRVLDQERGASYTFLEQMMRPKDMAFVIHFEGEAELLQDLTSSLRLLESALATLDTPQLNQGGGNWPGAGGRGRGMGAAGGTALYDAVYLASNELMRKQSGRKALIILSDGVDNASKVTLATAIESAQRADTLVYSILFSDEAAYGTGGGFGGPPMGGGVGFPGGGGMGRRGGSRRYPYPQPQAVHPDGRKILERISNETGARLFEVSKKQSVEQIYASIEEQLRNQYSLGYTPENTDASAGYRKISLKTKEKDQIVQTRDGYYPGP